MPPSAVAPFFKYTKKKYGRKEIPEVLLDIAAYLQPNGGKPLDLTNDCGEPTVWIPLCNI